MIEFMVIALPRSGTTWASNWLTTDTTTCIHDPLWNHDYKDFDKIKSDKMLGVSCTGLWMFKNWVNNHPARKVILHRDLSEVNTSLVEIGIPPLPEYAEDFINDIDGNHYDWLDIFTNPKHIYEYLLQKEFDKERHDLLKEIEMQPNFAGLTINKDLTKRLMTEIGA